MNKQREEAVAREKIIDDLLKHQKADDVLGAGPAMATAESGFETARKVESNLSKKSKKSRLVQDYDLAATIEGKTLSFPETMKDEMESARSSKNNSFDPFAPSYKYTPRGFGGEGEG